MDAHNHRRQWRTLDRSQSSSGKPGREFESRYRIGVEHFVVQGTKRILRRCAIYCEFLYGDGFAVSPLAGQKVSAPRAAIDDACDG